MAERVLIVGFSTRALAESAQAAGYPCSSVDAFGDLDQKARVTNVGLVRDLGEAYSPARVVDAALSIDAPEVAYVGSLENHPAQVARLARGRRLLGNSPETLHRVRDLFALAQMVRGIGESFPETLPPGEGARRTPGRTWLRKPRKGGGGAGVREWNGSPLGPREVLQERIEGASFSVSFAADGERGVILGFARGLAGDPAFEGTQYRYCGSLHPFAIDPDLVPRIFSLVQAATRAFSLVGVNGIDLIQRGRELFVLEVNPRYSASMELMERRTHESIFEIHRASCLGSLPRGVPAGEPVFGKAVLWARRKMVVGDSRALLPRDDLRDLPFPGEVIPKGRPVCTVFAEGATPEACYLGLREAVSKLEIGETPRREC